MRIVTYDGVEVARLFMLLHVTAISSLIHQNKKSDVLRFVSLFEVTVVLKSWDCPRVNPATGTALVSASEPFLRNSTSKSGHNSFKLQFRRILLHDNTVGNWLLKYASWYFVSNFHHVLLPYLLCFHELFTF